MSNQFVLSQTSEIMLKSICTSFHGILPQSHLTAEYLEEAVVSSLDIDPELHGHLDWIPRSHASHADIRIKNRDNFGISVKSGTNTFTGLKISGHRLSKVNGDFNKINQLLREYRSDVTICFVYANHSYVIYYIDKDVFVYPTKSTQWEPIMGLKTGGVTKYIFKSDNGLIVEILPKMSWQVWWEVPRSLCRLGFEVSVPKQSADDIKQQIIKS